MRHFTGKDALLELEYSSAKVVGRFHPSRASNGKMQGVLVHACNPGTPPDAEAGELPQVHGQPGNTNA